MKLYSSQKKETVLSGGDQGRLAWEATQKDLMNFYGCRLITAVRFLPSGIRELFINYGFLDHHIQNWQSPDGDTFKVEHAQAAISLVISKKLSPRLIFFFAISAISSFRFV